MWFLVIVAIIGVVALNFVQQDSVSGLLSGYPAIKDGVSSSFNSLKEMGGGLNSVADSVVYNNLPGQASQASVSGIVTSPVQVFFCPQEHCADQLIGHINDANQSIYVVIYSFTHVGISDALIRAKERGVDVRVLFDYDQAAGSSSVDEKLAAAGIPIVRRNGPGYMHNKFTVIDGNLVSTGSFNYSNNADTKNDENLVFIWSAEIAKKYKADFDKLWALAAN